MSAGLFDVQGLIAVITGGGTGIGLMLAQALASNGATVYIIGRRREALEAAAKTEVIFRQPSGRIIPMQGDVSSKESLAAAAAIIKEAHGYINILLPNAGIDGPGFKALPEKPSLAEISDHFLSWDQAEFTDTFAINATGMFFTVAAFLELLAEGNTRGGLKQKSQIITTSSIGGFNRKPLAGFAYGGSKAAVTHMCKQLSTYLAPHGIRSNVIAPGFYPSEMTQGMIPHLDQAGWPSEVVPERRAGDAEDLAGAVLFLTSRAGAYINGNVLITDGGRLGVVPASY